MNSGKHISAPGLKSLASHHNNPLKGYLPRDKDGAYRVGNRRDGATPAEAWDAAAKRAEG